MPTHKVAVLAGPPGSGKTERLLRQYRELLAANRPGTVLWLVPTWRAAAELRGRLLDGFDQGCFSPGVMTFETFAEAVLQSAPRAIRPMTRLMKRQLIRQLLEQRLAEGRLVHFGPIARTGGLVTLVSEFIGELKRLEIWPEHFREACEKRGISRKDLELLELYEAYQQSLREHHLYDAEGRFWSARDVIQRGQWPAANRLRLVVADGFTDFTRTQHEILELLARAGGTPRISLPLEPEPRRNELLTKPLKTLAELKRRHSGLTVEELPRPNVPPWPAAAWMERTLFSDPRGVKPSPEASGIEVLAAGREMGELEMVGRRVKELLCKGDPSDGRPVRPEEIGVVFRSPRDAGSLVAEVFAELGIPVAMELGQTLDRAPAMAALVGLLRLDLEDWPFAQVLAVTGSNYFRPDWLVWHEPDAARSLERALRRWQVPRSRERLLERLDTPDDRPAREVLAVLAAVFDELPRRATLDAWGGAWRALAERTGLLRAIEQEIGGAADAAWFDRAAWQRLQETLAADEKLAQWLKRPSPELDRREALAVLLDILASERVRPPDDDAGRVRVLSAASVRALRIPYVFLAGLSEKAFPLPDREDRLYNDAESQPLIDAGLPLVARTERNREEMLLFYEAVTRATRRLWLSYTAMDDSAQPLSPSPYLREVEQAFTPDALKRTELADLSPVPAEDDPYSPGAFRLNAMAAALDGAQGLLAGLIGHNRPLGENLLAALEQCHARQDWERFGPAEGMLLGERVGPAMAEHFRPDRTFSATELESYAKCSYRFLLERVLAVEPLEDLALSVDYMERGKLAHEVLAAFHRRVNEALGEPGSPCRLAPEECRRLMQEALAESLDGPVADGLPAAMREIDRRLLIQWTAAYRDHHAAYDKQWRKLDGPLVPELFEVSFGRDESDLRPPSTLEPLELHFDGETVRLSGRIDRIDTGKVGGTTVFNVLDYKTGGSSKATVESILAGRSLQLPLYAMATAELLLDDRNPVPWQAGYWHLKDKGFKPTQALKMYCDNGDGVEPEPDWEEIRMRVAETVVGLVRGMRRGEFPVFTTDPHCTRYCPYSRICRVQQIRALEKAFVRGFEVKQGETADER